MKKYSQKLSLLRKEYMARKLDIDDVAISPFIQFERWFKEAKHCQFEINAATLATANKQGRPSARQVLIKGFSKKGFIFYTNYNSRKGKDLKSNPFCALLFYWPDIERQVRIEGRVIQTSVKESNEYFRTRPRGSQISAWASDQSEPIESRAKLDERMAYFEKIFRSKIIPRPKCWGGYLLLPDLIEFWQGRQNRLHDRIVFTRHGSSWKKQRLSP